MISLFHKDLIKVFPDYVLMDQLKKCVEFIRCPQIRFSDEFEKINHYNKSHFYLFCCMLVGEMNERNLFIDSSYCDIIFNYVTDEEKQISSRIEKDGNLFYGWHNTRYLVQCYYTLQENFDSGLISIDDWRKIYFLVYEKLMEKNMEEIIRL